MSATAQVQAQVDAAVQAAVAPLLKGLAELTDRVAALESGTGAAAARKATAPPAKKAVPTKTAHAGTAHAKGEASPK